MPQSMANFDAALKDNYGPGLRNSVNNANPVLTEIGYDDENIIGRQAVWAVHTSRSASTGARAEFGTLPTADRQRYAQVRDDLVANYHTIKVSGQANHLTRGDEGAFLRALESELDGGEKDIKNDRARQIFGQAKTDGTNLQSGVVAVLSADPGTSTTLTMATATAAEMRYFFKGMKLDFINPANGSARSNTPSGGYTVTSVDKSAKTVAISEAADSSIASADYVVRYGNFGEEIHGLRHLISSSQKLANLDPATEPAWAAVEVGSSTTQISEVLFDEADETVMTDGDGSSPNLYIVEFAQRRKLASQLQAQKRYDAAQTTLPSGWKGLSIAQGTLLADRYCPTNDGFGITTSEMKRFVGLDWTWDDDDGKVLKPAFDGSDAVEARFKTYDNVEVTNRNSHVHLTFSTPVF